jgi:hypothetical protein
MSIQAIRKAQQCSVEDLAVIAATGVTRALAARQAAGVALSSEELSQVTGGLTILNGGSTLAEYIFDIRGSTWGMIPPPVER